MEFISKNNVSKLLGIGTHEVRIAEISETEAAQKEEYQDRTPQLEVKFEGEDDKTIKAWLNLKGYKTFQKKNEGDREGIECLTAVERKSGKFVESSEGYAVLNGKRVECPEKKESALSIIAKLGSDAGIPEGKSFGKADLLGKMVGIHLEVNPAGQIRFRYSMPAAQVAKAKAKVA